MATLTQPEYWMRGQVENIAALLQPVAHALLQAREEINEMMQDFPEYFIWQKPAGLASPAFHLQHLSGVLDRLFTYAKAEQLTQAQLNFLSAEGKEDATITVVILLAQFNEQVDKALAQLSQTDEKTLTGFRGVGRRQLPSTVIGLLFHAAEHTMRHTGQLLVTVKILKDMVP
ncbi:MAG TPA: DinB family protein [Panacibacter sp.]|nr:DinB family protein [Panacibacter sp.]